MIRIIVDSSSDYQLEELQQRDMELVPISVTIGDRSYLDGIDLNRDDFYKIFPRPHSLLPRHFWIFSWMPKKREMTAYVSCYLPASAEPVRVPISPRI